MEISNNTYNNLFNILEEVETWLENHGYETEGLYSPQQVIDALSKQVDEVPEKTNCSFHDASGMINVTFYDPVSDSQIANISVADLIEIPDDIH